MSVRPVPELPDAKGFTRDSYVAKEIRAFLRLKCDVAEVTVGGKTYKQIGQAMCAYLKKHANKYPNVAMPCAVATSTCTWRRNDDDCGQCR